MTKQLSVPASPSLSSPQAMPESIRHRRGYSDPFADLAQPRKEQDDFSQNDSASSMFEKLIVAPIMMISFLLSLSFVDRHERAWRVAQHDDGSQSWLSRWLSAEPYQRPKDSTWQSDGTGDVRGTVPSPTIDKERWYTHKKHRKMARLEFGQAFSIQNKMVVLVIIWALIAVFCIVFVFKRTLDWIL